MRADAENDSWHGFVCVFVRGVLGAFQLKHADGDITP